MEIQKLDDFGKSLSAQQVADFLGVSVTTVYSIAEDFGGVRAGKKYVFFENVFFERLKAKVLKNQPVKNQPVETPVLPGFDVEVKIKDLSGAADPHDLLV